MSTEEKSKLEEYLKGKIDLLIGSIKDCAENGWEYALKDRCNELGMMMKLNKVLAAQSQT